MQELPPPALPPEIAALLQRLHRLAPLEEADVAQVAALARQAPRETGPRQELRAEGIRGAPLLLLSGWACRIRILPDGRRQIVSFLLPGDIIGRQQPSLAELCSIASLTRLRHVDASPLFVATPEGGLARALHALALQDVAQLRDQVVRLGRQMAHERLASLLLEFEARLGAAGLAGDGRFAMPLTQEVLADALGLSVVHLNRTLQQLRREGLIALKGRVVTLRQTAALRAIADWQPPPQLPD
ncbi:Crp/Fnr family transcriptional regulator [Teichococcus deserti]|uniref:Crp/Fnr family transcriptional regulator n=1 Tax=Teichococcus deserti TaxID=1817963 RepID=UPI0013F60EF7|nr:helix-turn-helix domain-containing protein [Pseudoroseomonas deserti]